MERGEKKGACVGGVSVTRNSFSHLGTHVSPVGKEKCRQ